MKKTNITLSIALAAVFSASTAFAEAEVTGKIVHESAKFTTSGTTIGAATAQDKEYFKQETSARIFIDGDAEELQEGATYHVELQAFKDGKAGSNFDGNESDTQRDPLREAYVDGTVNDWSIRAGKQQVVWGTADGMKLLDAINPTDFSEMAQNQMEDSRIPVWMINAETTNEDGSEFQVVVSQPKSNFIAGLSTIENNSVRSTSLTRNNTNGMGNGYGTLIAGEKTTSGVDQGHAFIMKGVDSISGDSKGIINIVPELAEVAHTFSGLAAAFSVNYGAGFHLENWDYATVEEFVNNTDAGANFGGACPAYGVGAGTASAYCLQQIAANTNLGATNLLSGMDSSDVTGAGTWDQVTPDTAFEYMPDATFKTFATFANASSKYIREGNETSVNTSLRYKDSTKNGVNYSLNYMKTNDANPHIDLEWQNAAGQKLTPSEVIDNNGNGGPYDASTNPTSHRATGYRSIVLTDPDGNTNYGSIGGAAVDGSYALDNPVTLVLKEKNASIQNIGGAFDTAIETKQFGPVVIRGEALYQKDVMTPIVDKAKMSIGNITEAFTAQKGDRFKYVLGADITALTNMMVSFQLIQDRNLDYVDTTTTLANANSATAHAGQGGAVTNATDVVGARYTADMPTMAMDNQYQKAEENKEFYSLFLSKPFGASGEHRWNNIFMFEENGGKWNRLDAEFSIDDDTQATVEYNKYWGDANTQFGQLEAASNIQVGVKYSF